MDFSLIAGALGGVSSSLAIAKAAIEVSDFVRASSAVADVTQKLVDLQIQVIASNGAFMQLQQEHSALAQLVRELEEQAADRDRYELFELTAGVIVYRVKLTPHPAGAEHPVSPEPMHYLCPRCFNQKTKAILQQRSVAALVCPECKNAFPTGQRQRPLNFSPAGWT